VLVPFSPYPRDVHENYTQYQKSNILGPLNIQWLSSQDDARWDAFVSTHPLGLVYHLSAWKRVLEDSFSHIRGKFLVLSDPETGEIQAGLPVYAVKSWLLGNRTVSIPFASFCDPLISQPEELRMLSTGIHDFAERSRSRRIEIRSLRTANHCAVSFPDAKTEFKHHYLGLDTTTDALYASFSKGSIRQSVSKALRSGVLIEERFDEESLQICHCILADTRRRLSLPPMPLRFFESMKRRLGRDHFRIFLARHEGRHVACLIVLSFKDLWTSEYSGNSDGAVTGVNQLLYWETIRRAHASGARRFSFGRTSIDNNGLLEYKRRWATVEEDLIHFNEVLRETSTSAKAAKHDRSVRSPIVKSIIRNVPASIYQWIGDFSYRHLG
jgi:hypothetical protein